MLFDITAVLVASLALTGATGVVGAPESPPAVTRTVATTLAVTDPQPASARSNGLPTRTDVAARPDAAVGAAVAATVGAAVGAAAVGGDVPALMGPAQLSRTAPTLSARLAPTRGHGATFAGSAARAVDSTLLPKLAGRALLDQLALLPHADIRAFVEAHPNAVSSLLLKPPPPAAVSTWWALTPERGRVALASGAPELIGNLDGLDPALRDAANRTFLHESILGAERDLTSLGRAEKADSEQRLHMLKQIEKALVPNTDQPKRTLLSVDTAWPGRAAVVVGDLRTADYVSYMVPGMFFTVDGQIVDWTVISQDLYDEQAGWVDRLGRTDPALAGKSVAVVSWIGYQTPGVADIVSLDFAEDGAEYISSAVNGLHQTRAGDEPYVTLVTHSYGSTATLMALQAKELTADALVIIGSPGSAAQSVADIGMPSDRVFVGEAAWDPVVNSAFFGSDPGSDSFGATTMSVAGDTDPITGTTLAAASGHLGYFDAGTEAMRNMALVGLDRGDLVIGGGSRDPGVQLAESK